MSFSEKNIFNKEKILSFPIYKLASFKNKFIQDEISTSEHSIIKKKIIKPKKTILGFSSSLPNIKRKHYNLEKSSLTQNNKNSRNILPEIKYIESNTTSESKNKKKLSLINHQSSNNTIEKENNKSNNLQFQIQKLLKKHKINPEKQKKKVLMTNFLINENDITRKRYLFGFIDKENLINEINSNNKYIIEKKEDSYDKLNKNNLNNKPYLLSKNKKIKFDIDKLLKKRFKSPIEKTIIFPEKKIKKKLKLHPLKFNKSNKQINKINKKFSLDKIILEKNIYDRAKILAIKTLNISNLKTIEKKKEEEEEKKTIEIKQTILKNKKSGNLKENKKLKVNFQIEKNDSNVKRKKTEKEISKKYSKSSLRNYEENNINNNNYIFSEEEFSHEYEMSNSDSEEEKKKKKILKEKKKFSVRTSSSTLNLSKQIIKSYEYFQMPLKDKKFLIKLHPENLIIKKIMTSNYNHILINSKKYIYEKIKIVEKEKKKEYKYNERMFFSSNKIIYDESIDFINIQLDKIIKILHFDFLNAGLNKSTAFHLMNKYIPMSPQFIERFISNNKNMKNNIFEFQDKVFQMFLTKKKKKSTLSGIKLFDNMIQSKENLIFYQKFIYSDYIDYNLNNIESLKSSENSENENETEINKNQLNLRKKKKKLKLNILRKKIFFQMKGIKRKVMSNLLDKYMKYEDEIIKVYVKNIEKLKNKNKEDPQISFLCFKLFDYCIRNRSNNSVFRLYLRYHNLFDINFQDGENNNETLLIIATRENSINLVKYFLDKGANPNLTDLYGNTPMHYAISFKYFDIADVLRKNGGREDIPNFRGLIPWECINEFGD